jgi:uncharacterized hydrophobic protein (TIGR00271 family)
MNIIEGQIPEEEAWRALVLLSPGEELGVAWQLGLLLAQANNGQLLAAVIVPDLSRAYVSEAQDTLERVRATSPLQATICPLLAVAEDYESGLIGLVEECKADLVLARLDGPVHFDLSKITCAVAAVRGDRLEPEPEAKGNGDIDRILVPTSGGPNTIFAFSILLPLTRQQEIVALYVAPSYLGPHEEALGRARLRQTLDFVDAGDRISSKLVTAESVTGGIVDEAAKDYDLVIIGASTESSIDKVLFGNIPDALVRQSHRPVVIMRQPKSRFGNLLSGLAWQLQRLIPRMDLEARTQAYVRIRRSARPDADFFILISLASMIAALGLIVNSPAVVIGAMLVAPLMSPIVGAGLAAVLGDARFMRLSLGAVIRGVLLAVGVSVVAGLTHLGEPLTSELLARTEPSLIDLSIALFSGMAGAYALSHLSAAASALPGVAIAAALVPPLATVGITLVTGHFRESLGALLLFATNFVAISSATALVFLVLGFRPTPGQKGRREVQVRSVRVALLLLAIIAILLAAFTYQLTQESLVETHIRAVVRQSVAEVTGARLASPDDLEIEGNVNDLEAPLQMDLTARSTERVPHSKVVELQDRIGIELQRTVGLRLTVILVTELDPVVPPTQTPTPTATNTARPGVTPTSTPTPTFTPTATPTQTPTSTPTKTPTPSPTATSTPTATPTNTSTPTPTPTSTPPMAVVSYPFGLNMRAEPKLDSEVVLFLTQGTVVILLDAQETADGLSWQLVAFEGQTGWVSDLFLEAR